MLSRIVTITGSSGRVTWRPTVPEALDVLEAESERLQEPGDSVTLALEGGEALCTLIATVGCENA